MLKGHLKSVHQSTSCGQQWSCKWSFSHPCSIYWQQSHKHSFSHWCSRSRGHSRSRGWHRNNRRWVILPEGKDKGWAALSSPAWSSTCDDTVDWSPAMWVDFRNPPILDPHLSKFLSKAGLPDGEDVTEQYEMPEPPLDDPKEWVMWWAHWVETPAWWLELVMVPTPRDPICFAKHMWASFQFPKVKHLWGKDNDCTLPPAPHCIEWDTFLPQAEGDIGCLDYRLWQPKKTLALAKVLQFWADQTQPSWAHPGQLAECIRQLREEMKPIPTFTDKDVLQYDPPLPWKKMTPSRGAMEEEEELQKVEGTQGRSKM